MAFNTDLALEDEVVQAATLAAIEDAERVVFFLRVLGVVASLEKPIAIQRESLLLLGAGLRLLIWESNGLFPHRYAGLPEALVVIRTAVQHLNSPAEHFGELNCQISRLMCEKFAWNGPSELGADIQIGDVDDESLLEALADFLWKNRPR